MSVHKGVKYACNQCDSQFTQQGQLKQHKLSVHEGVRYPEAPTIWVKMVKTTHKDYVLLKIL